MKYFKKIVNGEIMRIDACNFNPCDGEEITQQEYEAILEEIKQQEGEETPDIADIFV